MLENLENNDIDIPKISLENEEVKTKKFNLRLPSKKFTAIFSIFIIVILFIIILPVFSVYRNAKNLEVSARELKDSVNSQDITVVRAELQDFKSDLESFQSSYNKLFLVRIIPVVRSYWKDGDAGIKAGLYALEAAEITIDTIEPYADIIGFAGADSDTAKSGEDTANDRIEFLVQSIEEITPQIDGISEKAEAAVTELDKINPDRYPKNFRGIALQDMMRKYIDLAKTGASFVSKSKPLMEVAPYLLGMDDTRTYMVLFQNDKELRATGGFITAYSIMEVDSGKVSPVSSSDIYHLDDNYTPSIQAPQPIIDYIAGIYKASDKLRLRDMNWSPDFRESMDLFATESEEAGVSDIDGIIAVDTYVLTNLLDAIGQIGVPGFGNFSNEIDERCNCPQVIYELESFADVEGPVVWSENEPGKIVFAPPNYDNRKKIVGPLMNSLLSNALGQPKEKLPELFEAAWKSITEKHVLIYMFDEAAQAGVESFGIAGRITDYDGDYLHVNDSNLGGRKSNLYLVQEIAQEINVDSDGSVTKILSLTYKNPQDYDGWLNSVLPNWTRIYVPEGSELISIDGFEDESETYDELGKTVFSGGFQLRPQGIKQIIVTYKLPFKITDNEYNLFIQKQPGLDAPLYTITVGKKSEELYLRSDKEFSFRI